MDSESNILSVDIEKVIRGKSQKLADRLPRCVINYIKKIIHQDEINRLLLENREYTGVEFATHILKDLDVGYRVHFSGKRPAPDGRYIFVSNHPLGGLDGMILISYIGSSFGDVKFIVNDLLMYIKPLAPVFVPVNKYGRMRHDNTLMFQETFGSDSQILYFPCRTVFQTYQRKGDRPGLEEDLRHQSHREPQGHRSDVLLRRELQTFLPPRQSAEKTWHKGQYRDVPAARRDVPQERLGI